MVLTRAFIIFGAAFSLLGGPALGFNPDHLSNPLGVVEHENYMGVSELGGKWLRVPIGWRYIEPEDNQFTWSAVEGWLDAFEAEGLNTSPVVAIGQMWANGFPQGGSEWPSYPPSDLQSEYDSLYAYSETYYDFVYSFAAHFRDRLDRITIENEVNTMVFWAGTAEQYRRVLATAAKAVEDAAPEMLVFDSGLGSGSWGVAIAEWMIESGQYFPQEVLDFANAYYEHDVYAPFEWNSYEELVYWLGQPFVQENIKRVQFNLATIGMYVDGMNLKFTEAAWLLRILITWIDDVMASYGFEIPLKINNEGSNWPLSSPAREGRNLFKVIVGGVGWGVQQTLWYPYSNELVSTPRRGLLDENGEWTPQAYAFQNIGQRIGSDHVFVDHDTLGASILRFRFQENGDDEPRLDAVWWDDGGHGSGSEEVTITLPEGTIEVRIYEYDGAMTSVEATDSLVTTITESPRFYEYVISGADLIPGASSSVSILSQNSPNPFGPLTTIRFRLPESADSGTVPYRLEVFDVTGRLVDVVEEGAAAAGPQTISWDGLDRTGSPLPAGTYWYRLTTPEGRVSRRMTLLR